MQHVNGNAADFEYFCFGKFARPVLFVDVAANGCNRGDVGESIENLRRSDVPGMNDVLRATQRFKGFGPKPAVGIGDDADQDGSISVLNCIWAWNSFAR